MARSAEKSLPFFETLKNIMKENKDEYRWTEAAEEAFQSLKRLILTLPLLTTPKVKEVLYIYLAAARYAISVVLLTERDGRQLPIHYVSRTLQEAEKNYLPIEKLALSLLHASRRLRRYFEAHPIKVITDQPIKQILNKAEASGRLTKYAVELGAYDITYVPRNAVKGQVLADFISEISVELRGKDGGRVMKEICDVSSSTEWVLYTDGASNKKGSGAGLVLIRPSQVEHTYALRLNFASTNNEAEYEALLAGLRIARKLNVEALDVRVDSKLVASQINGDFIA